MTDAFHRPWRVNRDSGQIGSVVDAEDKDIAQIQARQPLRSLGPDLEREALADFVVSACNNHHALLATCRILLQALEMKEGRRTQIDDGDRMRMMEARQVISSVTKDLSK